MAVAKCCDNLRIKMVSDNDSGIRFSPDSFDDIIIRNKEVVNICLNCNLPECKMVIKDLKKMGT